MAKTRGKTSKGCLLDVEAIKERKENAAQSALENQDKVSKRVTNPRHKIVLWMAACGASVKEICEATKYHRNNIVSIMGQEASKKEIDRLQEKIFGHEAKKKYAMVFPEAFGVARKVMLSEKTKAGVRAAQARDFMNRHSGMPTQKTETESHTITELILRLDESRQTPVENQGKRVDNDKIIDVTPSEHSVDLIEKEDKAPEIDVDSWIKDNLGEK